MSKDVPVYCVQRCTCLLCSEMYLSPVETANPWVWLCTQHAVAVLVLHLLFHAGGYVTGGDAPRIIRAAILQLCGELKDDAVTLVDVMAPTDFILSSPIGASDGQVFRRWWSGV